MSPRRRAAAGAPEGGLVVDKPAGPTSHDVVAVVRRALGQPRIGHTGTLDPLATGVLMLLLGRATRLAQFLASDEKTYLATIQFGQATSTYDAAGDPVGPAIAADIDRAALDAALARFRGRFLQTPPAVSAKRVGGHRAYDLARRDTPVVLKPIEVKVTDLSVVACEGSRADVRVACSAGFYVRSLAHDVGASLGVGAHLAALRRERSGRFLLEHAVSLDRVLEAPEAVASRVVPMAELLPDFPAVTVPAETSARIGHGQAVAWPPSAGAREGTLAGGQPVRILDEAGRLLAVAEAKAGLLHPALVLV